MELFDRYVLEVSKQLPRHLRGDVSAELRSLLQDQLEERAARSGRPADESLAREVLIEMGKPDDVATRYYPPAPALIGPELYPAFIVVLKIALGFLAAMMVFWTLVASGLRPGTMPAIFEWRGLVGFVGQYLALAFTNFGVLVLVFAILERLQRRAASTSGSAGTTAPARWNPDQLPKLTQSDRVSRGEIAWRIYVIVTLMALFNFFPLLVAATFIHDDGWVRVPFLLPAIREHLLWLNLWWVAALVLNVAVYRSRRWTPMTRWAEVVLGVLAVALLYRMVNGSPFIGIHPDWIADRGWDPDRLARLGSLIWGFARVSLLIAIVATAIETVMRVYRLLTRSSAPPWQASDKANAVAPNGG
jgi:hypothetical protein